MDRRQRMTLLGIAAVIAVAAVVIALVAGGGDDDDKSTSSTTAAQTETTTGGDETTQQTTTETTPPEPQGTTETIDIKGGEPDGGVTDIKVDKGDPLEITVNSDQELPIHFHGYDIEKDAGPGKPAVFKLKKADIDGVFEIEIESTKTKIASITVNP
jgi:FtsP/CotA-like multicopper oxidase with cupredoxin domain